jgi:hypothetical protein
MNEITIRLDETNSIATVTDSGVQHEFSFTPREVSSFVDLMSLSVEAFTAFGDDKPQQNEKRKHE